MGISPMTHSVTKKLLSVSGLIGMLAVSSITLAAPILDQSNPSTGATGGHNLGKLGSTIQ